MWIFGGQAKHSIVRVRAKGHSARSNRLSYSCICGADSHGEHERRGVYEDS